MIVKKIAASLSVFVLLLAACSQPNVSNDPPKEPGRIVETSSDEGTLKISPGQESPVSAENVSRSMTPGKTQFYHLIIKCEKGQGVDEIVELTALTSKEYKIKVQNNVFISLELLDAAKQPVLGSGKKMAGYTNIQRAQTHVVPITWATTPGALVLETLLAQAVTVQNIDMSGLQQNIDLLWGKSFLNNQGQLQDNYFNPLAVDIETIAADLKLNPAANVVHQYDLSTVELKITGYSAELRKAIIALIDEPFGPPAKLDLTSDSFIFEHIAPGNWNIRFAGGIKGTTAVVVPKINSTGIPATIHNNNTKPTLYDWQVTALNDNGQKNILLSAKALDFDRDPLQVTSLVPGQTTPVVLQDSGASMFYDDTTGDGIFEIIIPMTLAEGSYQMKASDGQAEDIQNKSYVLTHIDPVTLTGVTESEVFIITNPVFGWNSVAGANYYSLLITDKATGQVVAQSFNMTSSTTSFTPAVPLEDGSYSLKVLAHSDSWFFPCNGDFNYMKSMSIKDVNFSVDASGTLTFKRPDLGQENDLYFSTTNTIYRYNIPSNKKTVVYSTDLTSDFLNFKEIGPDGLTLLFSKRDAHNNDILYRIGYDGSGMWPVFSIYNQEISGVKWSPDGNYIGIQTASGNLYLAEPHGSTPIDLGAVKATFDFSPDGNFIFYVKKAGEYSDFEIIKRNLLTNTEQIIYTVSYSETSVVKIGVSGNNRIFVLYKKTTGPSYDQTITFYIYTFNFEGTDSRRAAYNYSGSFNNLDWTYDNRLMYLDNTGGGTEKIKIFQDKYDGYYNCISTSFSQWHLKKFVVGPGRKNFFFLADTSGAGTTFILGCSSLDNIGTLNIPSSGLTELIRYSNEGYYPIKNMFISPSMY